MGTFSNYLEDKINDHILKNTAYVNPATVYIGLSTADPLETGAGVSEPVGNNYTRKPITFAAAASRSITQNADVNFNQATGTWGTLTHYALFDSLTGGNVLASAALSASRTIVANKAPRVPSGSVIVSFTTGGWSNYTANKVLDFVFRNQAFAQPTNLYVALVETTELTDASTGSTIDEMDMTGYARELVNAWDVSVGGLSANTNLINFGQLTAGGPETITSVALLDAATLGNIILYSNTPNISIDNNDTVQILAGDFDVSLD